MSQKKADLSLNLIVMAIIALLVLVIIIYLFSTQSGRTAKGFTGCAERGGTCENKQPAATGSSVLSGDCPDNTIRIPGEFSDCAKEQICCKKIGI